MTNSITIAASGLNAAQMSLAVAAGNIANADSSGYQANHLELSPATGGGVEVSSVMHNTTPSPTSSNGAQGSNVDLATEWVALQQARTLYAANAAVIRTADQMLGTLLNILDSHHASAS